MMVKVLIYAYATGVFSSRGVARRLEEDVAFRVLGAGNFPQHRTLSEFRRRHLSDFEELFVEVVRLAQELGLASFGKLSIDGTKASEREQAEGDELRADGGRGASAVGGGQGAVGDGGRRGRGGRRAAGAGGSDELPAELRRREERLAAIRAAKERLEAAQRAADDARGRQPGEDRNPKGGSPYKRSYGEPEGNRATSRTRTAGS